MGRPPRGEETSEFSGLSWPSYVVAIAVVGGVASVTAGLTMGKGIAVTVIGGAILLILAVVTGFYWKEPFLALLAKIPKFLGEIPKNLKAAFAPLLRLRPRWPLHLLPPGTPSKINQDIEAVFNEPIGPYRPDRTGIPRLQEWEPEITQTIQGGQTVLRRALSAVQHNDGGTKDPDEGPAFWLALWINDKIIETLGGALAGFRGAVKDKETESEFVQDRLMDLYEEYQSLRVWILRCSEMMSSLTLWEVNGYTAWCKLDAEFHRKWKGAVERDDLSHLAKRYFAYDAEHHRTGFVCEDPRPKP